MIDLAIVGSGYGGSVIAARLAPHGRVLVLERGRRWSSGDFPTTFPQLARTHLSRRNPAGLWAVRQGPGTGNAVASGLGGGSLINYGITAQPDDHVFDEWPLSVQQLAPYYARARQVLAPSVNPQGDQLGDKQFLDEIEPGHRVDLENTIDWSRCTQCGGCVSGCNYDAKRSLDRTYLRLATQQRAEIQTEAEVVACRPRSPSDDGWELFWRNTGTGQTHKVHARRVVLAAGTFGSLDLLHHQRASLPTTAMFGQRMSMNGDSLAFLYNTQHRLSGHHGAPITTTVRLPFIDAQGCTRTLTIMSGRLPSMVMRPSARLLSLVAGVVQGVRRGPAHRESWPQRARRRLHDLLGDGDHGALSRTFMYKLDAEDSARGEAVFDHRGRSAIDWPDYVNEPILQFAATRLEQWAQQVGGIVVRDLGRWPLLRSFGVHPLGGCRMGNTPEEGVVDDTCRLFRPDGTVYPGLRVVDGSVIPTALGVPPSFTIAAVAERVADDLIGELTAGDR